MFSAATMLFLTLDPIGNIPLFLSVLQKVEPARRTRVVARELVFALLILLAFLLAGQHLLELLGISRPSFTIAGGVLLFLIALRMVFPALKTSNGEDCLEAPFIVPLAIPLTAGPSALATVLVIGSGEVSGWTLGVGAVLIAWSVTGVILLSATQLSRFLGNRGLIAMERLMGMLLVAIAVEMLLNGVGEFIHIQRSGPGGAGPA